MRVEPALRSAISGACRASTPISPAAPGTITISTSSSKTALSGVVSEIENLRAPSATSAPSSDTYRLLARDHAAPESTLALAKAASLGRERVRPLAWCSRPRSSATLLEGALVAKKLILIVIDGLTPAAFERAAEDDRTPALKFLAENGNYGRGISTFPSLTPVCLSSIATGSHPDIHRIPHLVWYHRGERRIVEYGSSFAAVRAAGTRQALLDAIFNMNEQHLGAEAVTVFEALEDAGYTTAAINFTCYRGRNRHASAVPAFTRRPAYGPKRFFFYNLFESDVTGAPLAVFGRSAGSVDAYAAAVGRWLVTRDGFDFLVHYLPDYDFASHAAGPSAADEALVRSDAAIWALVEAAGGPDEFLERYAVLLCADHGQTSVDRTLRLEDIFADAGVIVTASNRAGMIYRTDETPEDPRELAARLDDEKGVDAALFLEAGEAVARRA